MYKSLRILFLVLITGCVLSCVDEDDNGNIINGPTTLDFLMESPDHAIFLDALVRTQLDQTLGNSGNLTTFAPTDQAFAVFLAANDYSSVTAIPEDLLRTLVLYHIQSETRTTDQYNSQYYKTQASIDGSQMDVFVSFVNRVFKLNNTATVTNADNRVSNGIVHVVDNVLALPSLYTLLAANPDFTNLVTALNQEGFRTTLNDVENARVPFTVFAPSNAAFTSLIAVNPNDNLNNLQDVLNQNDLADKLLYHVLGNQGLRLEDFQEGQVLDPIGMGTFVLNTSTGFTILDGSETRTQITATNITAFNGVLHTVDFVLRQRI